MSISYLKTKTEEGLSTFLKMNKIISEALFPRKLNKVQNKNISAL